MLKKSTFLKFFFGYLNIISFIFGSIHFLISLFPTGDLNPIPYIIIVVSVLITPNIYNYFNKSNTLLRSPLRIGNEPIIFSTIFILFMILVTFIVQENSANSIGDWKTLDTTLSNLNLSFNNDKFGLCCYYPSGGLFYGYLTSIVAPNISLKVNLIFLIFLLHLNTYFYLKSITHTQNLNFSFFIAISLLMPSFFVFFIQNAMVANLAGLTFAMFLAHQNSITYIHIYFAIIGSVAIHPTLFFYFINLFLFRYILNSDIKISKIAKRRSIDSRFYRLFIFYVPFIVSTLLLMNYLNILNSTLRPLIYHFKNYILIDQNENGQFPNFLLLNDVLMSHFYFLYNNSLLNLFITYLVMTLCFFILINIKKFKLLLYFLATIAIMLILNTGQYWIVQILKFITIPFYGQSHRFMPILISQIYIFVFIFFSKLVTWFKSKYRTHSYLT